MDKLKRFQQAYNYLLDRGEFRSKTDCAKRMNRSRENVSGAYYGREPFFNDKFLLSFCREFPVINYEWLVNGTGDMLNQQEMTENNAATYLIELATKVIKENEELNRRIKEQMAELQKLREDFERMMYGRYSIPDTPYLAAAEPK